MKKKVVRRPSRRLSGEKTRTLCHAALLVVLMAVCSWVTIPTVVPFTLQTFAICLTLLLLGGRWGTLSIVAYLLLGTAGLPVFSGFRGGAGVLLGTTGGYLVGFLWTGLLYWWITRRLGARTWCKITALLLGLLSSYAFGTLWFLVAYTTTTRPMGLGTALGLCVLPFLLPDLCKLGLAFLLNRRLSSVMRLRSLTPNPR